MHSFNTSKVMPKNSTGSRRKHCQHQPVVRHGVTEIAMNHLRHRLVPSTPHVRLAVREKPVDDDADDGEEEHSEAPKNLVRKRAGRLDDLDCAMTDVSMLYL